VPTQKPRKLLTRIQVRNKQRRYKIDRIAVAVFCSEVFREIGESDPALSLAFVNSKEMQALNNRYLQKNYATDVLSFAYGEKTIDERTFLGEIIIAPEVSFRNARQFRVHPEKELKKLLIHGILHLLGYDHQIDEGRMERLQTNLMRRTFFKEAPLILYIQDLYRIRK
jgi:probable rRNA maturation factor